VHAVHAPADDAVAWPAPSTAPLAPSSTISAPSTEPGALPERSDASTAPPASSMTLSPMALAAHRAHTDANDVVDGAGRGRARPARPGDLSNEMPEPPAAGLHRVGPAPAVSAEGEPVADIDVVSEEDAD
jgi:hypothetical protein